MNPLDLLSLDCVFSQRRLLTPEEFVKESARRGVAMQIGHLEALHRAGALLPLYRAHLGDESIDSTGDDGPAMPIFGWTLADLRRLHDLGRLFDPSEAEFVTWEQAHRKVEGSSLWLDAYLYSPWQLLEMPVISRLMAGMQPDGEASFGARFQLSAKPRASIPREMIVLLSALEPVYYPNVVWSTHTPEELDTGDGEDDSYLHWMAQQRAGDILQRLGMSPATLVQWGEMLCLRVNRLDPVGEWLELVRLMKPERWEEAEGDALQALEHRTAAETIFRCREALAREGDAEPLPPLPTDYWCPQHERLT